MINVCAHYNGTTILLDSFETEEEAKEFMKYDCVIAYADELEDSDEDEVIRSDEMFIQDEIPFSEPLPDDFTDQMTELDTLPF